MQSTKSTDLIGHTRFLPRWQLSGCSVTRPILSAKGVWLARLNSDSFVMCKCIGTLHYHLVSGAQCMHWISLLYVWTSLLQTLCMWTPMHVGNSPLHVKIFPFSVWKLELFEGLVYVQVSTWMHNFCLPEPGLLLFPRNKLLRHLTKACKSMAASHVMYSYSGNTNINSEVHKL